MIKLKCCYYEQAISDGNEEHLNTIIPDNLPTDIKSLYELAHSQKNKNAHLTNILCQSGSLVQ